MQDLTQNRATVAHGSVPGVISRGCVQNPCTTPDPEPSQFEEVTLADRVISASVSTTSPAEKPVILGAGYAQPVKARSSAAIAKPDHGLSAAHFEAVRTPPVAAGVVVAYS